MVADGAGERVKKVKRNKRYKFPVVKPLNHKNVMCSIGNIVKNILITFYDVRWLLELLW